MAFFIRIPYGISAAPSPICRSCGRRGQARRTPCRRWSYRRGWRCHKPIFPETGWAVWHTRSETARGSAPRRRRNEWRRSPRGSPESPAFRRRTGCPDSGCRFSHGRRPYGLRPCCFPPGNGGFTPPSQGSRRPRFSGRFPRNARERRCSRPPRRTRCAGRTIPQSGMVPPPSG